MPLQIGDRLPQAEFTVMTADGVSVRTTDDIFKGRTVVLFAVPGAFTPTCHKNHLPGYLDNAEALKAKGVDAIAVTAVNDVFVMDAWAKASGGAGVLEFLADGAATFAKAIGMDFDGSARGMGIRSNRYSMLVEDGVVKRLSLEENNSRADASSAKALLAALNA
ncbi:peroxiredoxin [Lichenihabitans sp. PAMC28606]|uniref:peroxiredoxin n=1 Tax=Lichenihabitans sp. PAMC28606 TaxID=2880932 RepID=UPI001D09F3F4|nr:peroxiredoxin [Lichenihabitans sp. PAMC28606]UDL93496.1 peroxiredoxin [Lichenihabitans sp. PAMC28606]